MTLACLGPKALWHKIWNVLFPLKALSGMVADPFKFVETGAGMSAPGLITQLVTSAALHARVMGVL